MGFKVRAMFLSSVMVLGLAYYTRPRFPDTANNPGLKSFSGVIFNGMFLIVSQCEHTRIVGAEFFCTTKTINIQ